MKECCRDAFANNDDQPKKKSGLWQLILKIFKKKQSTPKVASR